MTQSPHSTRSLASLGRVHFIGIGGVGMSAVARIMVARGIPVSGSDAKALPVMTDLAAAGATIAVGYGPENLGDAQTVVAGSAIRPDNPELVAARAAGLAVLHRSEALAATMADDTVVAASRFSFSRCGGSMCVRRHLLPAMVVLRVLRRAIDGGRDSLPPLDAVA